MEFVFLSWKINYRKKNVTYLSSNGHHYHTVDGHKDKSVEATEGV